MTLVLVPGLVGAAVLLVLALEVPLTGRRLAAFTAAAVAVGFILGWAWPL